LKELSLKDRLCSVSVWTHYTSTADVTKAADTDSSGLSPACSGILTVDEMTESEVQRAFRDWK